eukprot:2721922-Alexandrium_andersonii.AAC.1
MQNLVLVQSLRWQGFPLRPLLAGLDVMQADKWLCLAILHRASRPWSPPKSRAASLPPCETGQE